MADDSSTCPRCKTKLSGETCCPVCGLDLSGEAVRAGESFADTLISALPSSEGHGTLGGYVIDGVLSSQARRAVLKAHPAGAPDRIVAIKVVAHDRTSPPVQAKLIDLARRAVAARHVSLATLLGVEVDPGFGIAYFVSEFAPGEDLAVRLAAQSGPRRGPHHAEAGAMQPVDVAGWGLSIVHALDVLHAARAVHMDIKPAHIVLDEEAVENGPGIARLVETGFAPVLLAASGHGETAHEPIVGTPTYVAPEQARDPRAASPASDLYSLGATMFHLVTGRPPFVGDSAVGILVQHASRTAPPVTSLAPAVPDDLARAIDSLLAKDPGKRPGAVEVARLLSEVAPAPESDAGALRRRAKAGHESRRAAFEGVRPPAPKPLSRRWLTREAMVAVVLVERAAAAQSGPGRCPRHAARDDIERALSPANYSPEASCGLADVLVDLGCLSEDARAECEAELASREKRRRDAAYGRLAIELGYATRQDLDRVLAAQSGLRRTEGASAPQAGPRRCPRHADTGDPRAELSEALVNAGVLTRERSEIVESSCLRYLSELDAAAHQRTARARGLPADAVTAARSAVAELPVEDGRSLFQLMMERGTLSPVEAWTLAAEHVRRSIEGK